ncbi:MAG TPA: hypothetical protein VGR26_14835 [Acidimicrobiales bacterium]|nr:hypothetical protein [Acidimicrobiales bacterium]
MAAEFETTHLVVGEAAGDASDVNDYVEACRLAWRLYLTGTEQTPTAYRSAIVDPVEDVRAHLAELRAGLQMTRELAVMAQRKVEAAAARRQQAFRDEQWNAANWWQKEADVWQEVLDTLGAQAAA